MRLFIFKSESGTNLRGFAADPTGSKLPDQFRPWQPVGVVAADKAPPHGLSRLAIERAIEAHGFQLWRIKTSSKNKPGAAQSKTGK